MRTSTLVPNLSLLLVLACSSHLTVGSAGSGGAVGLATGGRIATNTGGLANSGSDPDCRLGNACGTPNSTCMNGNVECTCINGVWASCALRPATGGTSGTGPVETGGNAGGPSTGDGGNGGGCATADSAAKASPQILFFVIDATGSMRDIPASGSTNGQRKWDVLKTVWPELVDGLPETWAVGMMEWACPGCPSTAYSPSTLVPIAPLDPTQREVLKNGLTADVMGGYTPTECAYNYALDQIGNWQPPAEFVDAPRFIVLLTDGVPTVISDCQNLGAIKAGSIPVNLTQYTDIIATVAAGTTNSNISTIVGGVPGSDEPQGANYDPMYMLSLLAAAGGMALPNCTPEAGTMLCPDGTVPELNTLGTAYCDQHGGNPELVSRGTYCHYDLTQGDFATGLRQALKAVKARLVRCDYDVPSPPAPYVMIDSTTVQVVYLEGGTTPLTLVMDATNDCTSGGDWYYSEQDPTTLLPTKLKLCPDTCTMVQADLDAAIDVRFECLGEV